MQVACSGPYSSCISRSCSGWILWPQNWTEGWSICKVPPVWCPLAEELDEQPFAQCLLIQWLGSHSFSILNNLLLSVYWMDSFRSIFVEEALLLLLQHIFFWWLYWFVERIYCASTNICYLRWSIATVTRITEKTCIFLLLN